MISNKDFVSMKTDVSEFIGDPSSSFLTKIGKYLNARYRDFMRRYDWVQLFTTYTFTTVANQASYAMPYDFSEAWYIWDNTNKTVLWQKQEAARQQDTSLTGSPDYYTVGELSMAAQPTSASVLSIVSTSASDTTQTVFIKGIVSGYEDSETITLTGTTPVSSTKSYTSVTQISKNTTTVGRISATSNSAAVTIATIAPGQLQARYRILRFFYIPSTTISIIIRYKRALLPMVNDNDYPIMDIADELIIGAQADAWRAKRQFAKADEMDAKYETMLNLKMFQEEQDRDVSIDPIPYSREGYGGTNGNG